MKKLGSFKTYKPGETIFREGDNGDCAYIVEEGRVQVSVDKNGEPFPVSRLGAGEIFGEMSLIDGLARSASVSALEDCKLCIVSKDQLFARINEADPVVRLLISVLLKRMRSSNHRAVTTSTEDAMPLTPSEFAAFDEAQAIEKIRFESELQEAFEKQQFYLHYQPIVSMISGEIFGFEALCRWNSPTRGHVSPGFFIEALENSSLMVGVGRWIHDQAMTDLEIFNKVSKNRTTPLFMSINVSGRQFLDVHFVENIEKTRIRLGLHSSQIKLEATERVFMEGPVAMNVLDQCRNSGYAISLDDFGTGYSSLSYLGKFPVDNLKIDRSFVMSLLKDPKAHAIVQAIISMAKALNIGVVAEGVETEHEMNKLISMGCDLAQGYYFAKPMGLLEAIKYVEKLENSRKTKKAV